MRQGLVSMIEKLMLSYKNCFNNIPVTTSVHSHPLVHCGRVSNWNAKRQAKHQDQDIRGRIQHHHVHQLRRDIDEMRTH